MMDTFLWWSVVVLLVSLALVGEIIVLDWCIGIKRDTSLK